MFSTSVNLLGNLSWGVQQANIGCTACPAMTGVRYTVPNNCAYTCYRDTTGENTDNDAYCGQALTADGFCPSVCLSCHTALASMFVEYQRAPWLFNGRYIDRCRDSVGHTWQGCDASNLPANAVWTSGSTTVGAKTACEWACPLYTTYSFQGQCLACKMVATVQASTCKSGEILQSCGNDLKTCVPCVGQTPNALQVWTSTAPFQSCVADCEPGVSWGEAGGKCTPCTQRACELGEKRTDCTSRSDASCVPCAQTSFGTLGLHQEYATAGLCTPRCVAGYYMTGGCVPCVPLAGSCRAGFRQTSYCVEPSERLAPPMCQACPNSLGFHEAWALNPCDIICTGGYVRQNGTLCVACIPSLCKVGELGICTPSVSGETYLDCVPCPVAPRVNEQFSSAGSCATSCAKGFALSTLFGRCVSNVANTPPATTPTVGLGASEGLTYPARSVRHSGMV